MFPTRFRTIFAALAIMAAPLAISQAQYEDHCGPFCEGCSHLRYFEPVDLDLDCLPVDRACGYTFAWDKLWWSFTGARTTIGAPGLTYPSEVMYVRQPQDDAAGIPNQLPLEDHPQSYTIQNGIQDAPPYAGFGWGDRIELGYFEDNRGFSISILDGPQHTTSEVYGFLPLDLGNSTPFDLDGDGYDDVNTGTGIIGDPPPAQQFNPTPLEILLAPTLNGFGSVHVNFDSSPGFFLGWRDYWDDVDFDAEADDDISGGRVVYVGPDGTLTVADGIVDDINGNGGTIFLLLAPDPDDPDADPIVIGIATDYGDLHQFNLRFNTLQVRNHVETSGIELMKTHILNNRHWMVKHQNVHFEIGYGMRYFRMTDDFRFDGLTDLVGRVFTVTDTENSIVGPQLRLKAARQTGKWTSSIDTRFMFGYNIQNVDQTNGWGDDAVPGGLNDTLSGQPTYSRYGKRSDDFTPFIEFRAELKYQLTQSFALKSGFNATYIDRLTRSAQIVNYYAPDFGIGQTGEQDMFMAGANFGLEFVH